MKKVLSSIFFVLLFIGVSHSDIRDQYTMTRSTVIKGAQTDILLSTASLDIYRIEVSSGNTGSCFIINGGTITSNKTSTQTFDTSNTSYKHYINQTFKGAFLTTKGLAEIRMYYNFTFKAPETEISKGKDIK